MNESASYNEGNLHAQPFRHQVGGHHACVSIPDTGMIAKPFDDRHEQHFYEQLLQDDLRPFVPAYYGVKEVSYIDDDNVGDNVVNVEPTAVNTLGKERARMRQVIGRVRCECALRPAHLGGRTEAAQRGAQALGAPHPIQAGTHLKPCILLEDLTAKFHYPCVLDIKMGTRAHPDDMGTQKVQRSQAKCLSSTSSSLGLRLCGMQRYDSATGEFKYVDKYHGRDLQASQVLGSIMQFLDPNPSRARLVIKDWVELLRQLAAIIPAYDGYRFYSSSLLLMYEGDPGTEHHTDARLIDFAHTRADAAEGPDTGFLFGLSNLDRLLHEALDLLPPP